MPTSADLIRCKCILATIAFGNTFFHGPVHRLGVCGVSGHISEAAGLGGGFVKGLPDIADSDGAGTGLTAVKGAVDHALFPRPGNGLIHIIGAGRPASSRRAVKERQNLSLGAILVGENLPGSVPLVISFFTAHATGSAYHSPADTSVKAGAVVD